MRLPCSLVLLLITTLPLQDSNTAARVLVHLWRSANGEPAQRPTLLAVVGNARDTARAATPDGMRELLPLLERASVPLIAYRPPRGDTLVLETTVPAFLVGEQVWAVGYSARACVGGHIRGYRTVVHVTCTVKSCAYAPGFGTAIRDAVAAEPCAP